MERFPLVDYFPKLYNPEYAETLEEFFSRTYEDEEWTVLIEAKSGPAVLEAPAKFVEDLSTVFGISPGCRICGVEESRLSFRKHVSGHKHRKALQNLPRASRNAWQSWRFVLGEMKMNHVTGELHARRCRAHVGLAIQRLEDLPSRDVWHCVSTQVAYAVEDPLGGEWNLAFPSTSGGLPRWKQMMTKPIERLNELFGHYGIMDHYCPVCENRHGLWTSETTGPVHYRSVAYQSRNFVTSAERYQQWPIHLKGQPMGRLMFDHITGLIMMAFASDPMKLQHVGPVDFPAADGIFPSWKGGESKGPSVPSPDQTPRFGVTAAPGPCIAASAAPPVFDPWSQPDPTPPAAAAPAASEDERIQQSLQRAQSLLRDLRPQRIYEQYRNPADGSNWWYDVVTRKPLFQRPMGECIILQSPGSDVVKV